MWYPHSVAVAACLGLGVFLTTPENGLAQGAPRMRMPMVSPPVAPGGPSVRPLPPTAASVAPPRLGPPPGTIPPGNGHLGNGFINPFAFYGWPYVWSDYSSDDTYQEDSTADYSMAPETEPASGVYPADDSVPDLGRLHVSFGTVASKTVVRLSWPDHGVHAAQVAFFLADESRAVLAAQTVRSAPFTAVFEAPPGTAFTGMTVVLPGGTLVTQYLPYRRRAH
jgi:hypothetical protein